MEVILNVGVKEEGKKESETLGNRREKLEMLLSCEDFPSRGWNPWGGNGYHLFSLGSRVWRSFKFFFYRTLRISIAWHQLSVEVLARDYLKYYENDCTWKSSRILNDTRKFSSLLRNYLYRNQTLVKMVKRKKTQPLRFIKDWICSGEIALSFNLKLRLR